MSEFFLITNNIINKQLNKSVELTGSVVDLSQTFEICPRANVTFSVAAVDP